MSGSSSVETATSSTTPKPENSSNTEKNLASNNNKINGDDVSEVSQIVPSNTSVNGSGSVSPQPDSASSTTTEPKPNLTPAPAPKVSAWKVVHAQDSPSILSALSKASNPSKPLESKPVTATNGPEEGSKKKVSGKEKWVPFTSAAPLFEPARPAARSGRNKNFSKTSSGSAALGPKAPANDHHQQSSSNNHHHHHHKQHSTSDDASKSKTNSLPSKSRQQTDVSKPEHATSNNTSSTSSRHNHQSVTSASTKDSASGHSDTRSDQRSSLRAEPNGFRKDGDQQQHQHNHHHFQPRPRMRTSQKGQVNGVSSPVSASFPRPDGNVTPRTSSNKDFATEINTNSSTFQNGSGNGNPALYSPHPAFHRGGGSSSGGSPHFHSKSAPPATGSGVHKISSPSSSSSSSVAAFNTSAAAAAAAAAAAVGVGSPPPSFGPFASYPYNGYPGTPQGHGQHPSYRRNFGSHSSNRMGYYPDYNFTFAPQYASAAAPPLPPPLPEPLSIVAAQVEYYFSIENLCKDMFLRRHMNSKGFVHVSVLANFNRVKTLSNSDIGLLAEACRIAPSVELLGDRIRKAENWETWVMSPRERLPQGRDEVDDEWIENQRRQSQQSPNPTGLEGIPPSMLFYPFGGYGYGLPPQQHQFQIPHQQQQPEAHRLSVASATAAPFVPKVSNSSSPTSSIRNNGGLKDLLISREEIPGLDVYIPSNDMDDGSGIGWMTIGNGNLQDNNNDDTIIRYYDLLNDDSKRAITAKFWLHYLMDNWHEEIFQHLENASLDMNNRYARNTVYELGSKLKNSSNKKENYLNENIDKIYNLAVELARIDEAEGIISGLEKLRLSKSNS